MVLIADFKGVQDTNGSGKEMYCAESMEKMFYSYVYTLYIYILYIYIYIVYIYIYNIYIDTLKRFNAQNSQNLGKSQNSQLKT